MTEYPQKTAEPDGKNPEAAAREWLSDEERIRLERYVEFYRWMNERDKENEPSLR